MNRSRAETLLLLECLQIAVLLGFFVDLATPWWTETSPIDDPIVRTGWGSLGGVHYLKGYAWWALIASLLLVVALVLRIGAVSLSAAVIAILLVVAMAVDAGHAQSIGYGREQAGLWTGIALVVIGSAGAAAVGMLSRRWVGDLKATVPASATTGK